MGKPVKKKLTKEQISRIKRRAGKKSAKNPENDPFQRPVERRYLPRV